MTELNSNTFFQELSRLQRLYTRSLTIRLGQLKVQPGYLAVLFRLWEKDGITQKELVRGLDIEQATLSNTLNRMERDGLVTRTRDKLDRRNLHIRLTEDAHRLQSPVRTALDDLGNTVNEGLSVTDLRYLRRIMQQMTTKLQSDQEEPLMILLDEVVE
ncbi:MarR family transcriptional regulator [Pseudodesulfovibrio cashew]|uniref:MarR family transcriptional regulator n=1 Tax=Pseudodesulfovibrio cashew TaxID=2678688 RepID=A0A6I6JGM7_9BACT|nr:MarR family transcriptional regulator [Pseudodesulfovibrio cashew]